jgi:rubrerythrin
MTVVEIGVQYKPCHCDVLGGEPHHHAGSNTIIPWATFVEALKGKAVTVVKHEDHNNVRFNAVSMGCAAAPTYRCGKCGYESTDSGCPCCGETTELIEKV